VRSPMWKNSSATGIKPVSISPERGRKPLCRRGGKRGQREKKCTFWDKGGGGGIYILHNFCEPKPSPGAGVEREGRCLREERMSLSPISSADGWWFEDHGFVERTDS